MARQSSSEGYSDINNIDFSKLLLETSQSEDSFWAQYPPVLKNLYHEVDEIKRMSEEEVRDWRHENGCISVNRILNPEANKPIPKPVKTFHQAFSNYPDVLDALKRLGFTKPTPIQMQAWPVLLSGEDMIGIAQTGTGKTLAFLLPAFLHIEKQRENTPVPRGPEVLVMAPTRELAQQIDRECKKYNYKSITSVCIYGGGDRREQIKVLKNKVNIIIATPGRLDDLIQAGHIDPTAFTYCVLDEADRMLDMGFEPQIRKTMYKIRPHRQTVLTSATWPRSVHRLAQSYTIDPVQVFVGSLNLQAVETVNQTFMFLREDEKFNAFMEWAREHKHRKDIKVIVFCGIKQMASELASTLVLDGYGCTTIHGNLDQADREAALVDICSDDVNFLVATDVASRGLDITCITHVVNFDFPRNIEEYVHRIGRTGRAGRSGEALSFFTRRDSRHAEEVIRILEDVGQPIPHKLRNFAEKWKMRDEEEEGRDRRRRY